MKPEIPLFIIIYSFVIKSSKFKSLNSLGIANLFIKPHMLFEAIFLKILNISKKKKNKTVTLFTKDRVCESLFSHSLLLIMILNFFI